MCDTGDGMGEEELLGDRGQEWKSRRERKRPCNVLAGLQKLCLKRTHVGFLLMVSSDS